MLSRLLSSAKTVFVLVASFAMIIIVSIQMSELQRTEGWRPVSKLRITPQDEEQLFLDNSAVKDGTDRWNSINSVIERAKQESLDLKRKIKSHNDELERQDTRITSRIIEEKAHPVTGASSRVSHPDAIVHPVTPSAIEENRVSSNTTPYDSSGKTIRADHMTKIRQETSTVPTADIIVRTKKAKGEILKEIKRNMPVANVTEKPVKYAETRTTASQPRVQKEVVILSLNEGRMPNERRHDVIPKNTSYPDTIATSIAPTAILQYYYFSPNTIINFAVYDNRVAAVVRLFAAQTHNAFPLQCHFGNSDNSPVIEAVRELVSRSDTFDTHYDVLNYYTFECPLPANSRQPPRTIYVSRKGGALRIPIPVHVYPKPLSPKAPVNLAACVKTARGTLDPIRLVEWFEMNKSIGVRNFIIYDGGVTGSARKVLNHYTREKSLTIVNDTFFPFITEKAETLVPKSFKVNRENKLYTQLLQAELGSINDCMYRFKDKYNYILLIDIDETLTPSSNESITSLTQRLRGWYPDVGAFAFPASHHFREYGPSDDQNQVPGYLYMMRHLRRTKPVWFQSKSIFIPDHIVTANWHMPRWPRMERSEENAVDERSAFVHHFRDKCKYNLDGETCEDVLKTWEVDTLLPRYYDSLNSNTLKTLKMLNLLEK